MKASPTVEGNQVVIRKWKQSDLESLALLRSDVALQAQLMARAKLNRADDVRAWLLDRENRDDALLLVAASVLDDSVFGYLQVMNVDILSGTGELGICISRNSQGKGIATEACNLLDRYLVLELGLRKLVLRVRSDNSRALAFYRKLHYREVGRFLRHYRDGEELVDVVWMERFLDQ